MRRAVRLRNSSSSPGSQACPSPSTRQLPAPVSAVALGAGPVVVAGELLGPGPGGADGGRRVGGAGAVARVGVADRAAVGAHPRTHAADVVAWLGWLAGRRPARWRPGGCTWTCGPPRRSTGGGHLRPFLVTALRARSCVGQLASLNLGDKRLRGHVEQGQHVRPAAPVEDVAGEAAGSPVVDISVSEGVRARRP